MPINPVRFGAIQTLEQRYEKPARGQAAGVVAVKLKLTGPDADTYQRISVPNTDGARIAHIKAFLNRSSRAEYFNWLCGQDNRTNAYVVGVNTEEQANDLTVLLHDARMARKIRRVLVDGLTEAAAEKGFWDLPKP